MYGGELALSVPCGAVLALSPPKMVSMTTAYLSNGPVSATLKVPNRSEGGVKGILRPNSPVLVAALREHGLLPAVLEHAALHQDLRAHAGVDARALLVVVVVEDVPRAEAQEGPAGGHLVEVVVGVGDAEVARVLGGVGVGVAYQGALGLMILYIC